MIQCVPAKDGETVKVTFTVAPDGVDRGAVSVVGDFNEWNPAADRFKARAADGTLIATTSMPPGRRYRFRYLGANGNWFDDETADDYERNEMGGKDCVLDLSSVGAPTLAPSGSVTTRS